VQADPLFASRTSVLVEGPMSEEWRRKAFYHTRVLIPVDEVLESAFGDCLVCLTGGQLNLVRNLLQYADRRSTFVSEYHERFYLAPTTEEWDALQAVVADLERNLMNCEEWSLMLEQVLLQGSSLYGSPATGAVIQPYVEDGTLGPEDPYWDDLETEDPRRCAIAQLTWHVAKDLLEEEVQPAQREVLDAILPIAIAAVGAMMGITVVTLPIAAVYLIVKALVTIWAEGELQNVLDELDSAKHDLVCAMYSGLETSYAAASVNAGVVLDAIEDLSAIDKIELKAAFAPWAMAVAAKGWDNASDWATSNVIANYCLLCEGPDPLHQRWDFPPDTDWTVFPPDSKYEPDGSLLVYNGALAYSPPFAPGAGTYDIAIHTHGCNGSGSIDSVLTVQGCDDLSSWEDEFTINIAHPKCPTHGDGNGSRDDYVWPWEYCRYVLQAVPSRANAFFEVQGDWTEV